MISSLNKKGRGSILDRHKIQRINTIKKRSKLRNLIFLGEILKIRRDSQRNKVVEILEILLSRADLLLSISFLKNQLTLVL